MRHISSLLENVTMSECLVVDVVKGAFSQVVR